MSHQIELMTQTDSGTMVTNPDPILSFFLFPVPILSFCQRFSQLPWSCHLFFSTPPLSVNGDFSIFFSCHLSPSRHAALLLGCQFVLSLEAESVSKENDFRQQTIKAWNLAKSRKREINGVNKRRNKDQEMLTDGKMSKWRKMIRKWKENYIKSWMRWGNKTYPGTVRK